MRKRLQMTVITDAGGGENRLSVNSARGTNGLLRGVERTIRKPSACLRRGSGAFPENVSFHFLLRFWTLPSVSWPTAPGRADCLVIDEFP
jgi:hypothetical protein